MSERVDGTAVPLPRAQDRGRVHELDRSAQTPAVPTAGLGPLATVLGKGYVAAALIFSFGVLYDVLPPPTALLVLALAFGCLLLAPHEAVRGARVSVPLLALVTWIGLSWGWSVNPDETAFRLWTSLLPVLALVAVAAVLRLEDLASAVRWSIRITLVLLVQALLTRPDARITGDLEGWRGTFSDKNSMALYLVFALVATLALDRRTSRAATLATIGVLLLGSQSATGLSAAVFAVLLWGWLELLRTGPVRQSAFLVLSSIGAALLLGAVVVSNLTAILEVYGKDADLSGRTGIWVAVVESVADRPFTGYGLGALLNTISPSSETFELWRQIGFEAAHAHSGALDVLGQVGAIGLLLYVAVISATAQTAVQRLRSAPRAAAFALVMLSAQLLMSVSENVFLGPWLLVLVIVQAGLLRPVP